MDLKLFNEADGLEPGTGVKWAVILIFLGIFSWRARGALCSVFACIPVFRVKSSTVNATMGALCFFAMLRVSCTDAEL